MNTRSSSSDSSCTARTTRSPSLRPMTSNSSRVLRVVGRDALDDALRGAEREAARVRGEASASDRLALLEVDELAHRRAAGQDGGRAVGGRAGRSRTSSADHAAGDGDRADLATRGGGAPPRRSRRAPPAAPPAGSGSASTSSGRAGRSRTAARSTGRRGPPAAPRRSWPRRRTPAARCAAGCRTSSRSRRARRRRPCGAFVPTRGSR